MPSLSQAVGRAFYGNFSGLRDIQRDAVEPILNGEDVIVLSPTGSGKTEAVTAPLVQRYLDFARESNTPVVLYITPTRALANDLLRRLTQPLESLGLIAGIRHGERNDLGRSAKPHLLITTPESLDSMTASREPNLGSIRAVLLDEAHLFYNTQRGLQLGILLHRLELSLQRDVQVAAISATVAAGAQIWTFLRPGRSVVTVQDQYSRPIDAQVRPLGSIADLAALLAELAAARRVKVLVFATSRRECDNLASKLGQQKELHGKVFVHHSSLSREMRLSVESKMQDANTAICVATSTLELGIDIGDIDLVIMYGPPPGWESFVQRVGRGNRRGNKSNVLCLTNPDGASPFGQLLSFEALLWQIRESRLEQRPAMELYGAAVQQLLTLLAERSGGYERLGTLTEVFAPWPHLNTDVMRLIADSLAESEFVLPHSFLNRIGAGQRLHQLHDLGLIWGNFPASSSAVPLRVSGREIGTIPRVNLARLQQGAVIRFAGQRWRVNRIRRDGIYLETAAGSGNEVNISYGGLRPPLDPTIIEAMLHLLEAGVPDPHMRTADSVKFTAKAERIKKHIGGDVIPVAKDDKQFLYFTFGGQLLNGAIARYNRSTQYRAGEIVLESVEPINFSALPDDIDSLLPEALPLLTDPMSLTVFQQLLPSEVLDRELAQHWSGPGVYARSLNRLRRSVQRSVTLPDLQDLHF